MSCGMCGMWNVGCNWDQGKAEGFRCLINRTRDQIKNFDSNAALMWYPVIHPSNIFLTYVKYKMLRDDVANRQHAWSSVKKVQQELMGEVCHAKLVLGDEKLFACLSGLQLKV